MTTMHIKTAVILCAAAVSMLFTAVPQDGCAAESDPSRIVARVRKTLDRLETVSCTFETEQVWKEMERNQRMTGTIRMSVKGSFRLRLERMDHLVVIDGHTIWTYLPKHNQVQISDYVRDDAQFPSPHNIFRRYADEGTAKLMGEEDINGMPCDIISLASGGGVSGVTVTVWIDRKMNFPVKAVEETETGYIVTHLLSDVRLNEKIDDSVFVFEPPKDATIVDMR
jgi:outer membrane lipoprotein-sorting protein